MPKSKVDPEEKKGIQTRASAGKALAVFIALMIMITWANTMLQEMTIATVSTTTTQRGSLEKNISASGTLTAEVSVPMIETEAARVLAIYASAGVRVSAGDALYALDYTDIVKTKREALEKAIEDAGKKQRTLNWAAADLTRAAVARLEERLARLETLEGEYESALETYEDALAKKTEAEYTLEGNDHSELEINKDEQIEYSMDEKKQEVNSINAQEDHGTFADHYLNDEQSQEIITAKQAMDRAKYQYEAEKQRLDGDTSVRDYINKKDELVAAEEALRNAELELTDLLATVACLDNDSYMRIVVSPVDGYVVSNTLSVGSMLSTNAPAMTISDQSKGLKLRVTVDEDSASEILIGDAANITVGTDAYQCNVLSIALSNDKQGMFDLDFLLPGDAGSVGISASMRLRKRTESYDIIIPLTALREDDDGNFVYVVEQRQSSLGARMSVRRVDVYVLDTDSNRAALQSGVSQRDVIVTRGDRELSDGDRIRIEEE